MSYDPMRGLDVWLERPYQEMYRESEAFYDWAENEGYDLDDPVEAKKAEWDYEERLALAYDDAMKRRWEENHEHEMFERDDSYYDQW